jgi:hypothetical protein
MYRRHIGKTLRRKIGVRVCTKVSSQGKAHQKTGLSGDLLDAVYGLEMLT